MNHPNDSRPLSPHLGIYRWLITNTLSILHRLTGVALSVGLVLVSAWLITAAWCPDMFLLIQEFLGSIIGQLFLFGWTIAFYYHLANGMRHLNWDMGRGFDLTEVVASARVVIVFTLGMTLATWALAKGMVTL